VGADPHLGATWGAGLWRGGVALVLGNEARGLSDDVAAQIDAWARLPIVGKAESLNVAVAGGVLMYAWLRENRGPMSE
jgi:TrmH family RNA methyltransferase